MVDLSLKSPITPALSTGIGGEGFWPKRFSGVEKNTTLSPPSGGRGRRA